MKKIYFILLTLLTPSVVFGQASTLNRLDQWVSTTTPTTAITQRVMNIPIRITGLTASLPLCLDSNNLITTTGCASAGGGGAGTWSTTTSSVLGQLINYPNNDTDILTVGSNATTTAEFFFDPNTNRFIVKSGNIGIGTTTPQAKLEIVKTSTSDDNIFSVSSTTSGDLLKINSLGEVEIGAGVGARYATVAVNSNINEVQLAGAGFHAFEDWSTINSGSAVTYNAYAAYDAKPTITGSQEYDHFVGFQSRPIYSSSGNLTNYFRSIDSFPTHNGSGTIVNATGLRIADVGGTGPIYNDYGIYISPITRGSQTNYGLYIGGASAGTSTNYALYVSSGLNYFGGATTFSANTDIVNSNLGVGNSLAVGLGSGSALLNKAITVAASTTNATISSGLRIYNGGAGTGTGASLELGYGNSSGYTAKISGIYNGVGQVLTFGTNTVGNEATEKMRIDHLGNVGIGTTSPGTLLSLGNTGANTVNISPTATSTFGSGINLRTGCFAVNGVCISGGGGGGVSGPVTTTLEASCEPQTDSTDFAPGGAYWQPIYGWTFTNATSSRIMCNVAIPKNLAATPNISIMPYISATSSAGTGIGIVDVAATSTGMLQNWYTTNYTEVHSASTTASKRWALTMGTSLPLTSTTTITLAGFVTPAGGDILKFEITRYGADANDTVENDLFIPKVLVQLDTN